MHILSQKSLILQDRKMMGGLFDTHKIVVR